MYRLQGLVGVAILLGIAYLMSNNKKAINWRTVLWGLGLQLIFALFILKTPIGKPMFDIFDVAIKKLLSFTDEGSAFLFDSFVTDQTEIGLINFAFRVLPTVVFFSALMAMLYHWGVMQWVVKWIAKGMQKTMGTSGAETLSVSGNIFIGQTEAPLMIRPFVKNLTQSELMTIMTGGFATVAGGVMAFYVSMLGGVPGIAGHLLAASVMSAPAAIVFAKIMIPETEVSTTAGTMVMPEIEKTGNAVEAFSNGAEDGLKLAFNIAAMLIAFVAAIAAVNYIIQFTGYTLEEIMGYLFSPLAWAMGAQWSEATTLGSLLGQKIMLTELIAYKNLGDMEIGTEISQRTSIIASYALCGFANFASVGIQLGGIGGIAPSRRGDLAKIGFKAMLAGAFASWLTASIAGILI